MEIPCLNNSIATKLRFTVLFLALLISGKIYSQTDHLRIRYYSLEDGLSQVSCNNLTVDNSGFIWIATENGLNRFDGKEFRHFKYSESDSLSLSGNYIKKLLVDKTGRIWIGTVGNGLNYYNHEQETFHAVQLNSSNSKQETITDLIEDNEGNVWVASQISGLHRLQNNTDETFTQKNYFTNQPLSALFIDGNKMLWAGSFSGEIYRINPKNEIHAKNESLQKIEGQVHAFYQTNRSMLIGGESGLYSYNLQSKKIEQLKLEQGTNTRTKHVTSFLNAGNTEVWIGTGNGLYLYNWENKTVIRKINYSDNKNDGLSNNTVLSLLKLNENQVYVGTSNNLNLLDFNEPYFKNISKDKRGRQVLNDNVIFSILKDADDLWIGTSDGGLNLIRGNTVYYFKEDANNAASISGTVVRAIVKDTVNNRLWLATTRGLNRLDLDSFNPDAPRFTVYQHEPENTNSISGDFIKDIALDHNNRVWGATFGQGVFCLELNANNEAEVLRYQNDKENPNSLINDFGQCIKLDKQNNIWVGTQGGLSKFDTNRKFGTPEITNYYQSEQVRKPLSHNSVYDILIDKNDKIWLGTRLGLNLFLGNNEFESWTNQAEIKNNIIYSIQDDERGNLWLGTNEGIVNFITDDNTFKKFSLEDGIQSNEFDIHAKFRDLNGTIYLGGIAGLSYFHPNSLDSIDTPKPLYFSQLRIKDQLVKPGNTFQGFLTETISNTKQLEFKHDQFPFYLQFSSIDFRLNKDVKYAYKLLPADTEWNPLKDPEIQFLNLPSGKYTLQINGFSRGIEWNQSPLEMNIEVLSPWWASWWAYIIYLGIAVAFADRFYRFQLSRKLAVEESKRLKEVNRVKNTLYTNITHEFRTPLTVINGMTDSIKTDLENNEFTDTKKSIDIIERNSNGLLHLVNDMLDLAKIESGSMKLKLIQADVIPFVKYLSESFHSLAHKKHIQLTVYSELDELVMDFDSKKLSAIISNLLSNAIKFAPPEGKVIIHLNRVGSTTINKFVIKIKDNGPGISKEEIDNIFNRFYQSENPSSPQEKGTGIGLALSKEFVELMHGTIQVESDIGKGCTFIINLPVKNEAPQVKENMPEIDGHFLNSSFETEAINDITNHTNLPLVLIIEDNEDVAYYLQKTLTGKYKTLHAKNGELGIEMALNNIPDIIISDVMMPKKDGFQVCATLKSNELSDHIPIILLTAKAAIKDRLAGLSYGADAYLAKPFIKAELFTRLDQLILSRSKMRQKFESGGFANLLNKRTVNPETKFIQRTIAIIHNNISNHSFGSAQLAFELHLSESQVYRKLKAISGKSTAVFIRSVRLQKAKELIQTTDGNISEIAYEVGFNDPAWFSRAFKEEFGFAPSAIHKNLNS